MAALKSFALLLLFVSAACGVYYFLLPAGNVAETAKKLLSVFFLACAAAPLFTALRQGGTADLFSFPEETQSVAGGAEAFAAAGEQAVRRMAEGVLDARTDVPYELRVETHIGEDLRIDIQQVTVIFERDFAGRDELTAALTEALGARVRSEVKHAADEAQTPVGEEQSG